MAIIKHIEIRNFRSIQYINWWPKRGLNCIIGPGDSGKSTILDAIDLVLGARRSYPFTDADFHLMNTGNSIEITVTLGELDDSLKNLELYGYFFRGFNNEKCTINDEPQQGDITVLSLRLVVREDLEPEWLLYSQRAEAEGVERRLQWKHREILSPTRLGMTAQHHLAWGNRSILNKLSESNFNVSSTLAQISRLTRDNFAAQPLPQFTTVLGQVRTIANDLGVPVGDLKALLDVNGVSLTNGAISLHDCDNTPLRQMGTGSSRLLISGLHKAASSSKIIIIDEAEYGLEPYRISRFLQELGSKEDTPTRQIFITTHSPYVLRELKAQQLHILRKYQGNAINDLQQSHTVFSLNGSDQEQATLRACAEAFFSKAVIVGEGATEVGLLRGFDFFWQNSCSDAGFLGRGVSFVDGSGGDNMFKRAETFSSLGYPTALLKDSDITHAAHQQQTENCKQSGVNVFEWGHGLSTEGAIFNWCPLSLIPNLVQLAIELNGEQEVAQHMLNLFQNNHSHKLCITNPTDEFRPTLASAASKYKWFKNITNAEHLAITVVAPNYNIFSPQFQEVINHLYGWVKQIGG